MKSSTLTAKFSSLSAGVQPRKCIPGNNNWFMMHIANWSEHTRSGINNVPTTGTGKIAANPTVFAGNQYFPKVDLGDYIDILDNHASSATDEQIEAFVGYINRGDDPKLKSSKDQIQRYIDATTDDNNGLVNVDRSRLRFADDLLYQFINSCIEPEDFMQFHLQKKKYTFIHEADSTQKSYSGLMLFIQVRKVLKPIAEISVEHLETTLEKTTLSGSPPLGCNFNWNKYASKVQDLLAQILAAQQQPYCPRTIATAVFKEADKMENREWSNEVYHLKRLHGEKELSLEAAMAKLSIKYTNMITQDTWGEDAKNSQVIALATDVNKVRTEMKSLAARIPKKEKEGTKPPGTKPPPTTKAKKNRAPKWQITKVADMIKHPDTGIDMIWCPEHISSDGEVNGMYMPHPHNHEQWAAARKKKRADMKAAAATKKRKNDGKHKDDTTSFKKAGSINNGTTKLALTDSFKTALMTQLCINETDIDTVINEAKKMDEETQSKE